jgi:hypothetical protein
MRGPPRRFSSGAIRPIWRRMMRVIPWLGAMLVLLVGCGGDGAPELPSRPLGTSGLSRALDLAHDDGRMKMRLTATTTRPGRGTRPQFDAAGEVDLGASAGEATLDLDAPGLPDELSVTWTADRVTAMGKTLSRASARTSGGQLGMLPDEVQAMAELVRDAEAIREVAAGSWTFTVPAQTAVRRGIPPQPEAGESWAAEAQAASDGRLRRVQITLPTPALGTTIPAGMATLELTLG